MKAIVNGGAPLYYQIKEYIKEEIQSGKYKPGDRIPAEPELRAQYEVSRITIRRAVEELCQEGFLEKRHGTGTFVRNHQITRKIENLMSFTDSCSASGMVSTSQVLKREHLSGTDLKEDALKDTDDVLYIQRVRMADGDPIMLENNYYPAKRFAFLEYADLTGSLYRLLEEDHSITVCGSRNSYLDIVRADAVTAGILHVNAGHPLFFMHTEIYDSKGQLIHVGRQYINSERYRVYLDDMNYSQRGSCNVNQK